MKCIINFFSDIVFGAYQLKQMLFFKITVLDILKKFTGFLDPIEEEEVRDEIINFFNEKFPQSESLNFNLYYSSSIRQFYFR